MTDRPSHIRYRMLAWLTLAAALSYFCRNAGGVAESSIRTELGLTLKQSGWFMGAFFWTYAIFQVPSGWLSERVGTRFALSMFAITWSVATLCIGVAPGFWLLVIGQLVMGAAQAGIFPASCNSINHWMPLAQRSMACGILAAGMQIGAISASGLSGALLEPIGWRWVFIVFALPGMFWTAFFLLKFRDQPALHPDVDSSELAAIQAGRRVEESSSSLQTGELRDLLMIARQPVMWWLCGQQVCRSSGYMFFASWFPTFLQKTRDVSIENSGYLQGVVLAGTLIGSIVGGMITDWIWRRTGSLRLSRSGMGAASLGLCAALILSAWFVQSASLAVVLLAIGSMFAAIAGPCAFAASIDIGGQRTPQVFGLMNMCGNFAVAACPVLVGILFEWTANWNVVLLWFAGVYLAGSVCWVFVNPQGDLT